MSTPQALAALGNAQTRRLAKTAIVRDLRAGRLSILDLVNEPPDVLRSTLIPDLLKETPRVGVGALRDVGKRATWANVNLLLPLGEAPERTREWLVRDLSKRHIGVRP